MLRLGMLSALAALMAATSACSGADGDPPSPRSTSADVVWTVDEGSPVSQIVDAGDGVGLLYVVSGERLELRALEISTGKQRWSVEVSPTANGVWLVPPLVEGKVITMLPGRGRFGHPAVIDVLDGSVRKSPDLVDADLGSGVDQCESALDAYCFYGTTPDLPDPTFLWLHGPELAVGDYWDAHPDEAEKSDGLDIEDKVVRYRKDGAVVWSRPRAEFFKGAETGLTYGFPAGAKDVQAMYVARAGAREPLVASDVGVLAASLVDGRRLWQRWGVALVNRSEPVAPTAGADLLRSGVAVACEYRGQVDSALDQDDATPVAMLGIEATSGEELWRFPADVGGDDCSLHTNDGVRAEIRVDGKRMWLDIRTGETTAAEKDEPIWAPVDDSVALGRSDFNMRGVFEPRDGDGKLLAPTWPLPEDLGATDGKVTAVVIGGEVRGYVAPK